MLERDEGGIEVTCDDCGIEFDSPSTRDFYDLIKNLKDSGWKIFREGGEWKHLCPDCQDEPLFEALP